MGKRVADMTPEEIARRDAASRRYYLLNREREQGRARRYYAKHGPRERTPEVRERDRLAARRKRARDPERCRATQRDWRERNRERILAQQAARKAERTPEEVARDRERSATYYRRNKASAVAAVRARDEGLRTLPAVRTGMPWLTDEEAVLYDPAFTSDAHRAVVLGRSVKAITAHRIFLARGGRRPTRVPLSDKEKKARKKARRAAYLAENPSTAREIRARYLGDHLTPRRNAPWTPEDDAVVMSNEYPTDRDRAAALGRPTSAVSTRRYKLRKRAEQVAS